MEQPHGFIKRFPIELAMGTGPQKNKPKPPAMGQEMVDDWFHAADRGAANLSTEDGNAPGQNTGICANDVGLVPGGQNG